MAGHAGKAFWFSKPTGKFITSSYYYDKYPEWVNKWNKEKKNRAYAGKSWSLMYDKSTYLFGKDDDKEWEMDIAGFGKTFPHQYGSATGAYFNSYLTFSPAADELTLDFAKAILDAERLGQDEVTDYLSISFSTTDYVGHLFGNSSLESEDNLLRLDRTLADLFAYVDSRVGLENTLIVLSADHGGPEAPGYWKTIGLDSGYVSPDEWDKEPAIAALKKKFGIGEELIQPFFPSYVYLNREVIKKHNLDFAEVEQAVADIVLGIKGVAVAITSTSVSENKLPDTQVNREAICNFNPKRSGDILVLFQPHYFINHFNDEEMACNHGGPWSYDTFVPVIFAGNGLKHKNVYRRVETISVARTLAAVEGIKPPSGCFADILPEVLNNK
jgi:arylsulfatase A-like enzyme